MTLQGFLGYDIHSQLPRLCCKAIINVRLEDFKETSLQNAMGTHNLGVSKNRDTQKWMIYNGKPMKTLLKWMIWGENPLFSETSTCIFPWVLGSPKVRWINAGLPINIINPPRRPWLWRTWVLWLWSPRQQPQASEVGLELPVLVGRGSMLFLLFSTWHWNFMSQIFAISHFGTRKYPFRCRNLN